MQKELSEAFEASMSLKNNLEEILQNLQDSVLTVKDGKLDLSNDQFYNIFKSHLV